MNLILKRVENDIPIYASEISTSSKLFNCDEIFQVQKEIADYFLSLNEWYYSVTTQSNLHTFSMAKSISEKRPNHLLGRSLSDSTCVR